MRLRSLLLVPALLLPSTEDVGPLPDPAAATPALAVREPLATPALAARAPERQPAAPAPVRRPPEAPALAAAAPLPQPPPLAAGAILRQPPPIVATKTISTPDPGAPPAALASAPPALDPASPPALPPELADDSPDDADDPPDAAPAPAAEPELASVAKETWIFSEPRWKSHPIGYLRAGAVVKRRPEPAGFSSCDGGWYRVEPRGYVCIGKTAALDVFHPVVEVSTTRPRRDGLPYTYVMSRSPPPPVYARLPTEQEQRDAEPDLPSQLRKVAHAARDPLFVVPPPEDPLPSALLYGRALPAFENQWRSADALLLERAKAHSGYALLSSFDHEGRRFGLTTDLGLVPIDRTRVVRSSDFSGITFGDGVTLPVAFVRKKHAVRYVGPSAAMARGEALGFRAAVPLTGASVRFQGETFLVATDGSFVREDDVVRVDRFKQAPAWAASGRKWIDVSILRQSLVAYEGEKPVYATLVSTGRDGIGDPKKTHSTIQGVFLIHTKHISTTMDGDEAGDEFDLRDVPFVQYFTEGFALHAAYWHDEFGTPRSHGCVNLAPKDAAWLFGWTTPDVPAAWHGALSLKKGTVVYTHP